MLLSQCLGGWASCQWALSELIYMMSEAPAVHHQNVTVEAPDDYVIREVYKDETSQWNQIKYISPSNRLETVTDMCLCRLKINDYLHTTSSGCFFFSDGRRPFLIRLTWVPCTFSG